MSSGFTVTLDWAGQAERFEGVAGVVEEALGFFELDTASRAFPCAVVPREIDIPARLLEGWSLEDAVARVYDPEGVLVLSGRLSEPRPGRRGGALRFTITDDAWEDGSKFPAPWGQRITVVNQTALQELTALQGLAGIAPALQIFDYQVPEDLRGSPTTPPQISAAGFELFAERIEGRAGPIVFGAPGFQEGRTWPATPAPWVDTGSGAQRLQPARHWCEATEVTVFGRCVDGQVRGKVAQLERARDATGALVTLAVIEPLLAPGPQIGVVGWHASPGATGYGFDCVFYAYPGGPGTPVSVTWDGTGSVSTHLADLLAAVVAAFPTATVVDSYTGTVVDSPYASRPTVLISLPTGARIDQIETYESPGDGFLTQVISTGLAGPEVPDAFVPDVGADWWCAWHAGPGLPGGAGDVISYVLRQTTLRVDGARLEAQRRLLNAYELAGYVDQVVGAVEWLTGQLAWLPISWVQGRDGIFAWLYDPLPVPVAMLDEDDGFAVQGDIAFTTRDPVAQVQLRYRSRDDVGDLTHVTTQRSVHASAASRGAGIAAPTTDLVDRTDVAERAAALRQRALHTRHPVVTGQLSRSVWGWLRVGDPVEVRAPSVGVVGVGYLTRIADDGRGPIEVAVTVLRDPVLTERAALTGS